MPRSSFSYISNALYRPTATRFPISVAARSHVGYATNFYLATRIGGRAEKASTRTRSSHGQLYPRWRLTLAAYPRVGPRVRFNLLAALMDKKLLAVPRTQLPAVAESSANVTVTGGVLKRRTLAKMRVAESSSESHARPVSIDDEANILKDFVWSKSCVRIPATGESPHLVPIKFYSYPDNYPGREPWPFCIPDFGAYWNGYNFERSYRRVESIEQELPELNGEYIFYQCRNDELPPNKYLMTMLGVESLSFDEYFWYGDVFITRFHEDDNFKYFCEDVPHSILAGSWIEVLIRHYWARQDHETEFRRRQSFEALNEKMNADKQIILGRMTASERKVLEKMPAMLDFLAITACDDGALVDWYD